MTNRERLLADLSALDNAALYHALTDNRAISVLEHNQCEDCEAKHDGACPYPDSPFCDLDTETYMDWPCTRPRIYPPEEYPTAPRAVNTPTDKGGLPMT